MIAANLAQEMFHRHRRQLVDILLKEEDSSGNKRREALLAEYRRKLDEDRKKMEALQSHIDELEWHVHQLEKAEGGFTECPGALCASCQYSSRCIFFTKKER